MSSLGLILGLLLLSGHYASSQLSCNSCDSMDSCELPTPKDCAGSSEVDQCFMFFEDEDNSVTRMGCKSELSESEVAQWIKQLYLCDGNNCNAYEELTGENICAVCDSTDDVSCAVTPDTVTGASRCKLPNPQCFSKITEGGITVRGCLASLETEEFLSCREGNNANCQVCGERSCNKEIFPENRSTCHRCNSSTDTDCQTSPDASAICPLYVESDTCVTKVVGRTTTRGCGSEISCEGLGKKDCLECSGSNCNIVDLLEQSDEDSIGDPGTWQGLPINCYTCDGDECSSGVGALRVCVDNDLQTCTTVFGLDGKVAARGCSDLVAASYGSHCDENPGSCYDCKSNGCNLATSKDDYIDCIFCDAKTNPNCTLNVADVSRTRKCYKTCMTALYPRTSDKDASYELTRSCLDDKDLDDRERCDQDPLCESCTDTACNTQLIPEVRKSCIQCSGDSCQLPEPSPCRSWTNEEQCSILFDEQGSILEAGCKSDYDPQDVLSFLTAKRLFLCDEDNCNEFDSLPTTKACRLCNSRTDKNCATDPQNVASSTSCRKVPITDCYTRVLDDGHTERGCLSSLESDVFLNCYKNNGTDCKKCSGDNCNNEVFPVDRLSCHTCSSADDASCDAKPKHSQVCLKHSVDQGCVTAVSEGITQRGCSLGLTCDAADTSSCRICDSTDCNVVNLKRNSDANPGVWQGLPLNCYTCTGDECKNSLTGLNYCAGNANQHCVTVFGEDNSVVRRGCSDAVEEEYGSYCDESSEKCFNCNSNGCNLADSLNDYINCIYCDSRVDKNCVLDVGAVSVTRRCHKACMSALYQRSVNESSIYELSRSCLDDKDLDDREDCGSGDSLCKTCTGDRCNVEDAVDERLECHTCEGDSCENPTNQKCTAYAENDTCFILFGDVNDITQMGCTSQLSAQELEDNLDKLFTCSEKNCNEMSNLPQPQKCSVCDSANDIRCATNPGGVPSVTTCSSLPHVDCYTRVKSDGTTARGCLSDLTKSVRLSCLSGNQTDCATCIGNGCNSEIFPEDRLTCHKCNSKDDPTCQSAPDAPYVCPIYKETEVCSSKLVNDVTYRSCGSEFRCDDSDKQFCKMCNSTNCNRADLYQNNIGYPGQWQGLPINCYTCFRDECNETSTTLLRKCENNNQQNCVTVFNPYGRIMQRGCSDTIYEGFFDHHCDNHPELCTYCKSSGCNNAESIDDYVDCVFCDSATNPNCTSKATDVTRTRKCHKQCMTALYPRTNEDDPAYELSRSCLDDKDLDDRDACAGGNDQNCKVCEGASCNTEKMPAERLSCWRCSGDECEDAVEAECPSYRENDRCLILFDESNTIVQMGCRSDFDNAAIEALRKKILFCDGNNCNDYSQIPGPHKCLVCDSANETLCATDPSTLISFKQCNNLPYTSCFTRIEAGSTKRGCLSDVEVETIDECVENGDSAKCNVCESDTCNNGVYPADRRSCHHCSSADDANCDSNPTDPSICPIYQDDDECVVEIAGEKTNRGCLSQFSCDASDRDTCRICADDNCNSVDLLSNYVGKPGQWQDLPLACYECEGDACKSLGTATTCEGNYQQNCMTVFDSAGEVIKRGCSEAIAVTHGDYCDTNIGKCQSCKSSECNAVASLSDYVDCVFCDSATNPNCVLDPSAELRTRKCHKQCMASLYPKSLEDDTSYELSRSCLDDKEEADRTVCESDNEETCKACAGENCNTFAFPAERHQCWTCRGEDCEGPKQQDCVSYSKDEQCYILFNTENTVIAMGCRSEYERTAVTDLIRSKSLLLCDGLNCNSYDSIPSPTRCVVCNSANDTRCATNPNLIPDAITCSSLPYTGCFTRINEDGDTERGCQASLPNTEFYGCLTQSDSVCDACSGAKCNGDVYPSDRLRCHRCNSTADANCAEAPASNTVCPKFLDGESCVASYKDGATLRGCSSELSCDMSNKKTCRVCSGSACNKQNLEIVAKDGEPGRYQDLPINCYTCEGAEQCAEQFHNLQMCTNNNVQNCMTVFNAEGTVVQRGCSDPVTEAQETWCEANQDKCFRCNSNGCNMADNLSEYVECVICDSSTDPTCVRSPTSLTKTRNCYKSCMTTLFPRSTEDDPSYDLARTCLDDKDLDDRATCQEGTEEWCKACDGEKCNVQDLPADRRSCYQCSGDSCQLPEKQLCSGYRSDDQCFILFDENQGITDLGCKSDLTVAQSVMLVKAKRLLLCDGDDCNDINDLPVAQSCALCNSRTDVNCAVNPSSLTSTTSCRTLPYTQCYSRVLEDGATERGCLSNLLNNDFYDCLIGNSTTCESCEGGSCNNAVFPANRISCQTCDSSTDPNCETSPANLSICPKYTEKESCVTSFIAGTTSRGCGTSIECDASNRRSCRVCTSSGCNVIDLASKQDDNFGKWQDLPLSCFSCEGDACQGATGESTKCENNNEQDCLTVFNAEGKVIRRGCSDEVEAEFEEHCDTNTGLCLNCKSNECNVATALTDFTECVYCDSNKDTTCVTNPRTGSFKTRKCAGGCMVALYPSDSTTSPAYDLIRTCLDDKDAADQTSCSTGKEPLCRSCTGASCNKEDLPEDRLRCHSCVDDECEEPVSQKCPLYKEGDQCFIRFDSNNGVAEMGCLSAFRGQEIIDILKTKQVYMCEGDDCNDLSRLPAAQRCALCDSANDVNCAINPTQVGSVGTCSVLPYPNCYTKISSAGTTVRGCLADLAADEFAQCILSGGENCSQCIGDGCNKKIFPESRLRCYSCTSKLDPDCESWPTTTSVCPYIRDSEKCVSALGGNLTERGCSSQLLCDTTDKSTCRHCSATGCNTLDLFNKVEDHNHGKWQELPLRCHSCSGDLCKNSLGPAVTCTSGDQQDCMTVFEDGEVVRRGCQFDVEDEKDIYCRQNPDKCQACKSNECNDAWSLDEYVECIYCNSELDSECASNPTKSGFPIRKCAKGCMAAAFTGTNGTTQVIRTCLDDKELFVQYQCASDPTGKDCSSCAGQSCNNFNYPKDRLGCHVCKDSGCSSTEVEYCAAYVEGDSCFAKYESGRVDNSGCVSAVESSVIQQWKEQNKLYTCSGESCNAPADLPSSQTCVVCDSSKNVECATDPSTVSQSELCEAPISSCFSNITSGVTHRGCLRSLTVAQQTVCQEGDGSTRCATCDGEKCNSEIYPSDRRRCHICDSDTNDKCRAEPDVLSVCPNYLENNLCVVKLTNRLTERGCSSDLTCDVTDEKNCEICNSDGCNTVKLDNGARSLVAGNLLTLLLAIVGVIGVQSKWFGF